jgi:hypothetical protein
MTKKKTTKKKASKAKVIISGVECPDCKKRMFSFHVHDYKTCGCPNETMIDGGREYIRCGGHKRPSLIEWNEKIDGKYPVVKYVDTWPY